MGNLNLADINRQRKEIIDNALANVLRNAKNGVEYTAADLSKLSEGIIPIKNFEASLSRGYSILKSPKRTENRWWELREAYCLFGDWQLRGEIKEKIKRIIVKEFDEDGKFIKEYIKYKTVYVIIFG